MARPKKQTVEYFPHYVNSGKTMFILENSFGNDGYAFWFKVLELLGMTDGHVYNCRNTADWEFLLAKTHVSEDLANKILKKLADLDAIDSELWEEGLIWSDNFVKNLTPVYNNRKAELPKKPVINNRNDSTEEFLPVETEQEKIETPHNSITTDENTQSKVEESKVDTTTPTIEDEPVDNVDKFSYIEFFNNNFGHLITAFEVETLEGYVKDGIEPDVIVLALQEAVEANIRDMRYVKKVLNRWLGNKLTTVEAVMADKRDFELKAKQQSESKFQGRSTANKKKTTSSNFKGRSYSKDQIKDFENKLLGLEDG